MTISHLKIKILPACLIGLFLITGIFKPLQGQSVTLQGQIYEYATYYISSFNIQTGASDVQLFRYRLDSDQFPVWCKMWFKVSMVSPSLGIGITEPMIIVEMTSDPFQLQADLIMDNRDMSTEQTTLYDMASPPNPVNISVAPSNITMLNPSEFDMLMSSIITSGRLADGEYNIEIKVYSGPGETNLDLTDSDSRQTVVRTPTGINLESPGGALADTTQNTIFTLYPVFSWYSQSCTGCQNYIRVAEFDPGIHTSMDEAIEDETSLPFNQSDEWEEVGPFTSFQYPLSNARPLEFGKVYVWQIRQTMSTTAGAEALESPIFAFKIANPEGGPDLTGGAVSPLLQMLQQVLGDDQFNALFASGSVLDGYTPVSFTLNDVVVDEATVNYIINQILNETVTITNIEVE